MSHTKFFLSLMGWGYRILIKPVLFFFPPERMHQLFGWLGWRMSKIPLLVWIMKKLFVIDTSLLTQSLHGLTFANPVGIAAGFDKDANLLNLYSALGCGYTEIGSITLHAYAGNTSPQLIRLPKDEGIFVNYGLKNYGADRIVERLAHRKDTSYRLFVSVARTNCKETADSLDCSIDDYEGSIKKLLTVSSQREGITLNISCPNARSGEQFATPENLQALLERLSLLSDFTKPVFLKMPLLDSVEQADELARVASSYPLVKGLVVSNLLKDKTQLKTKGVRFPTQGGGISGKPTQRGSDALLRHLYAIWGERFTLVGVGGIFSAQDAYRKICLGASLLQVATGLIYRGPQLLSEINHGLVGLLQRDGFSSLTEAIGSHVKKQ